MVLLGGGPLDDCAVLRVLQFVSAVFQLFAPPIGIGHLDPAGRALIARGRVARGLPDPARTVRSPAIIIPASAPAAVCVLVGIISAPAAPMSTTVVLTPIIATAAAAPIVIAWTVVATPTTSAVVVARSVVAASAAATTIVVSAATMATIIVTASATTTTVVVTATTMTTAVITATGMGKGRSQHRCLAWGKVDGDGRGARRPDQKQHHQPRSCRTVQD